MQTEITQHIGYDPLGNCGKGKCPICARTNALFSLRKDFGKTEFMSDSFSVFVGRFNYPNINVGILEPPSLLEDSWIYDSQKYWAEHNFEIPRIVALRSSLINSRFKSNVLDARKKGKFLGLSREISMASEPVDIEVHLEKVPKFNLSIDSYALPMGPNAQLKKIFLTQNPRIPAMIEKVVSDTDLKAIDGLNMLYKSNFDENTLTKLLSIGNLGLKKDRKLVPTRFSITAVDCNLGNNLADEIKKFSNCGHMAFFGGYLGNYFLILLFTGIYSYELFETYVPSFQKNNSFTSDFEPYGGRKKYAEQTAGGFYASRLAITEKLMEMKRQASVLVLRFITPEYTMPLGVFVVRECVRKTLKGKPIEFGSRELMLKYAEILIRRKFNIDINFFLKRSKILREVQSQSKLVNFF